MEEAPTNREARARPVNLNILPVLRELLRQRSVTRAAAVLNMSQSAVSDALSRLRRLFDDELLIPSRPGFELSAQAMALEPIVEESLRQIEILLNARPFDSREASGRVRIAASDYATLILGPALVHRLSKEAPGVCIQFHDADDASAQALADGRLDFIIMPEAAISGADFKFDRVFLFEDEFALISSSDSNPEDNREGSKVWGAPETFFDPPIDGTNAVRAAIRQHFGEEGTETIVLPGFLLLPFFVENTEITAVVHRRLAERLAPAAKIRAVSPPFRLSKISMFAAWSRSQTNDPLHRWLVDLLVEIGAEITGGQID